ncbi:hypothetical protein PVAG01_03463 [Phlyctema vagabunda]|uniref:Secreted protein n=1 Tax=Phlyctema vagabunda TaxID=108571 RepID=A0ABR4PLG7_9HELO
MFSSMLIPVLALSAVLAAPVETLPRDIVCNNDIPGGLGCNPAHSGSCPPEYFADIEAYAAAYAAQCLTRKSSQAGVADDTPTGASWTVLNLIRTCSADNTGCDYTLGVDTNDGGGDNCSVVRTGVANAATESWYDVPCKAESRFRLSWGYAADGTPPFAVITVVNSETRETAFFGVSNVVGQNNGTYGSGHWGNIGPEPVYIY